MMFPIQLRGGLTGPVLASAPWTPPSLGAALRLWLKADAGLTLSGSNVTTWADQSGNGCDLTAGSVGGQITYSATGFNSLPTVNFVANAYLLSSVGAMTLSTALGSFFMVGQMLTGTPSSGRAMSFAKNGASSDWNTAGCGALLLRSGSSNAIECDASGAALFTQAISLATNYRLGSIFDGAHVTPYVNNSAGTPGAYTTSFGGAGRFAMGLDAAVAANENWVGPISEVVVTDTALSPTDRSNLDAYFQSRWGL